ncbi:MAG: hypothetical protein OHK0022_52800 [Roseiflexaceae bacterium]
MSGHTLIYRLKHAPETGHIPVMALTAYTLQEDRQAATDAGCDAFEPKPIDLARWLGKVQALLRREN